MTIFLLVSVLDLEFLRDKYKPEGSQLELRTVSGFTLTRAMAMPWKAGHLSRATHATRRDSAGLRGAPGTMLFIKLSHNPHVS